MKKLLLTTVTGTAVASGAYFVSNQNDSHTPLPQLDYVPADTVFFWSQLEGFPYLEYLDVMPEALKEANLFEDLTEVLQRDGISKNELFFYSLINSYSASLKSSEAFAKTWGADNDLKMLGYAVGFLPVARAKLANVETFVNTIKTAAEQSGVRYEAAELAGVPITRFIIEQGDEKLFDIVVSTKDDWVTLTLDTAFNTEEDLKVALAATKPAKTLSETYRVERYINDYQLDGQSLAYLDTTLLVDALTAKDPQSNTTRMLDSLLALLGSEDDLALIRNEACQQDFADMASNWPAIVSGTQKVEITHNYADLQISTVFASTDKKVLDAMSNARGFIPEHAQNIGEAMISFGLGVNASQVSPMVNTVWARFASADFSCQPLVAAQAQSTDINPAALAMMTGMLGSLKGISFSLIDIEVEEHAQNPGQPDFKSLNVLVTISADDAEALFKIAKSYEPTIANITLPKDGTAIEIKGFLPKGLFLDEPTYVALKGNHLTFYTGEQGKKFADTLTKQKLEANGMMAFSMNTDKFFKTLLKGAEIAGEELGDEFEQFIGQNTQMQINLDVADKGVVTDTQIMIKKL